MGSIRKQFSKEFKAKVALEAIKGLKTTAELSSEFGVHPTQINQWKNELREGLPALFEGKKSPEEKSKEQLIPENRHWVYIFLKVGLYAKFFRNFFCFQFNKNCVCH